MDLRRYDVVLYTLRHRWGWLLRRILVAAGVFVAAVVACCAYVGLRIGDDLLIARNAMSAPPTMLTPGQVAAARTRVAHADHVLSGFPAVALRYVPVVDSNVDAVQATLDGGVRVLEAELALQSALHRGLARGLVSEGRVRVDVLRQLRAPVALQVHTLRAMREAVSARLSGWLAPPLYTELERLDRRLGAYTAAGDKALGLLRIAPGIAGADGRRVYLVGLMNNAELRGAGGILSGVGTLTVDHGRLHLGPFRYYADLARMHRPARVPAPGDFRRRFGRFNADTTRWVNVTASPDVPEVATVARRLYRLTTGVDSDGMILVDPRGVQALLPPDTPIPTPSGGTITASHIADYVYSRAYQAGARVGQAARRRALIAIGRAAFEKAIAHNAAVPQALVRFAQAAAGGHVRFVSFRSDEERALDRAGATGAIAPPPGDALLVTVQNFGGDKLDFWARRSVAHACNLKSDRMAVCETRVSIANHAPSGLPAYVRGGRSRPDLRSEIDVYIPGRARLIGVTNGSSPLGFFTENDLGMTAIGTNITVPRGGRHTVAVFYRLPLDGPGYSLRVVPQPLAHDARLSLRVRMPSGWAPSGVAGSVRGNVFVLRERLSAPVTLTLGPSRPPGMTGMWQAIARFMHRPVSL